MIWCFNVQQQFVDRVESGSKSQTVRALRKDGRLPKAGDTVKLYSGLRTKNTRLLRPPTLITLVERIQIGRVPCCNRDHRFIVIDGIPLDHEEECEFAMRDGFRDTPNPSFEFKNFFTSQTEATLFEGFVVHWSVLP